MMRHVFLFICCAFLMTACGPHSPKAQSELAQGKRYFDSGYYKRAMSQLLPLATDGNAEAQYAVGYMYYYGLGVPQDTDSGFFWIKRSADQHFVPAADALMMIEKKQSS